MQQEKIYCKRMILAGLTVRTNNKNEMNPSSGKIGLLVQQYWNDGVAARISNRTNPGLTYTAYTDYESNEHGDYTFFVGEAVESDVPQPGFRILVIPEGSFQKFTTEAGKMPDNIIQAWQAIWAMNAKQLGGKRNYIADFEVYDRRAMDINNGIIDICIGVH